MRLIDLVGLRFERLTVISRQETIRPGVARWLCRCDCGQDRTVTSTHLRSGHTRSCGCLMRERTAERNIASAKHGMWRSPEFSAWSKMIARCYNKKNRKYSDYGGRGIAVCDEWRHDFMAFYQHIGPRPSPNHSVDRIQNNDGYRPGNVRWATYIEQNNNRRSNITAEVSGEILTAGQIAARFGLMHNTVLNRIKAGKRGDDLICKSKRATHLTPAKREEMIEAILMEFGE